MTSLAAGKPAPLGASYDGKGVNFALFSAHAERVELYSTSRATSNASISRRAAATSGTAGWPPPGRACATAIGYMVPGTRRRGTALTRPSC